MPPWRHHVGRQFVCNWSVVGFFEQSKSGCGVWNCIVPDGTEYVLVGIYEDMAIVRLPDSTVVAMVPGP